MEEKKEKKFQRLNKENINLKRPLLPATFEKTELKRGKENSKLENGSKIPTINLNSPLQEIKEKFESDDYLSIYRKICEKLLSKNIPEEVNFRDKEKKKLKNFLAQQLATERQSLSTLIISGKPGGGKTLLIQNLLNEVKERQWEFFDFLKIEIPNSKKSKKIQILEVNAMKFASCFPFLVDCLGWIFDKAGIEFNPQHHKNGLYLLEQFRSNLPEILENNQFVLLVDELDTLATHDRRDFDLIIDFLNIEQKGFLKLGISNTLDLFATYKGTKNYLNSKKLVFKPYGVDDLNGILKERICESFNKLKFTVEYHDIIDRNVFNFVCKKIYKNESGDIRAMLNVARTIFDAKIEQIRKEKEGKEEIDLEEDMEEKAPFSFQITMEDVTGIINEKYQDKTMDLIRNMSISHQVCIFALYFSITIHDDTCVMENYKKHLKDCKTELSLNSRFNLNEILETLQSYGILKVQKKSGRNLYGNVKVISLYKKFELKEYLIQIERFKRFILDQ